MMSSSIVSQLSQAAKGMCQVGDLLYNDFTATLFTTEAFEEHGKTLACLADVCTRMPVDNSFRPAEGELVAARSTEGWARAIVLSQVDDTYHMAFCDLAFSQKLVTEIRSLPAEFAVFPRLGVRISPRKFHIEEKEFRKELKPGQCFRFVVTEILKHRTQALLFVAGTNKLLCEVDLSAWSAKWEDRGLRCVALTPGEYVQVMVHCSAANMYVRSMAEKRDKRWRLLIQEVGAHCYAAKALERMPDKGQMVACKYLLDGTYYRALVVGFRDDEIQVCYVDFGNTEYVQLEQLKHLSQKLIQVPCQAVLVKLKNVDPRPMTKDVVHFLNRLVLRSTRLAVMFDESYSREGIELMEHNKPISQMINSYLEPYWKQALAEGKNPTHTPLMGSEIPEMTLETNRGFRLTILTIERADTFYGCPTDSDVSHYVLGRLHEDLAAFCRASTEKCYVPRVNELCIVRLNLDNWYRGHCVDVKGTVCFVLLIDYGKTVIVNHEDVRKMCEDFIWIDSLAVLCAVDGLSENLSDDLATRLKQLIKPFTHHQVKVTRVENGCHFLHMPAIVETLTNEGFLS